MTAEGPRFGATPQNPDLLRWIGIQVLLLVLAWVNGMVVRRLLDFAEASDPQEGYEHQEVCRVTIPPSTRPVYLKGPKGKGEGARRQLDAAP